MPVLFRYLGPRSTPCMMIMMVGGDGDQWNGRIGKRLSRKNRTDEGIQEERRWIKALV
jgi:hypothetical protein